MILLTLHPTYATVIIIQTVDHAKYLGVIIDNHLLWSKHISQITKKALSVKAFLQRNFNSCPIATC